VFSNKIIVGQRACSRHIRACKQAAHLGLTAQYHILPNVLLSTGHRANPAAAACPEQFMRRDCRLKATGD
jgi:hypothetical protein